MVSYWRLLWTLRQVGVRSLARHGPSGGRSHLLTIRPSVRLLLVPGEQAAGVPGSQHLPHGGPRSSHGGGDGAGLPAHLAAVRRHGAQRGGGLQPPHPPHRGHRPCGPGQEQHRLQPHHIHLHEQTGQHGLTHVHIY